MSLRENPGTAISGGAHVALLLAALISFSRTPRFDDASESIPVEMVSDQQFNQIMKGEKTAAQMAKPQQRVEKLADIADAKPLSTLPEAKTDIATAPPQAKREQDPGRDETKDIPTPPERAVVTPPVVEAAKPTPKPEQAKPASTAPTPVKPPPDSAEAIEPKSAPNPKIDPKQEPKQQAAAEPKPVERPKKLEPKFKPDQVAKLLQEDKKKEPRKPTPRPKSGEETADPSDKFDLSDISKFLNKDAPQRKAATGAELQQVASLGSPTASAAQMSPSLWGQLDGLLQEQYKRCWSYIGTNVPKYIPEIHVQYAEDGALIGEPSLLNPPSDPNLRSLAESAIRAVRRCNPLRIPAQFQPYYDQWKGRVVRFDPEDML